MTNAFLEKLNATHQELIPLIEADVKRVVDARAKMARQQARRRRDALHPDTMESLIHTPDTRVSDLVGREGAGEASAGESSE